MKFGRGQRVRLIESVTPSQNSNADYLRGKVLVVAHYTDNVNPPYLISCEIEKSSDLGLYAVTENQIKPA